MSTVSNSVRGILRLEALTVFAAALTVWFALDGGWLRFLLLFLLPDLSIAGYAMGPRLGAAVYNIVHSYVLPVVLGLAGGVLDNRMMLLTSALWLAHIALDRTLGFGLKLSSGFRDTHLGEVNSAAVGSAVTVAVNDAVVDVGDAVRPKTYSSANVQ